MTNNQILYSKYTDLSKIYDLDSNKLMVTIPSPNYYYDVEEQKIKKIMDPMSENSVAKNYSILGLNNNNNNDNNKSSLIKLKSGFIALKIPYIKLFKFYVEE